MRLIDADKLMKTIRENDYLVVDYFNSIDRGMFTSGILQAIDELLDEEPTVDAVTYEEWFSTNCETCKEYDKEKHCCPKFRGVIKQTLKDFEENNKIVRCEDCKHYCPVYADTMGGRDCLLLKTITKADDYCSYGERKENVD